MKTHKINLPICTQEIAEIKPGDKVLLSGELFTARDAAHKRMIEILDSGAELPFDLSKTAIFYCGPSPKSEGNICGAVGPTTSSRMDAYTPRLLQAGLRVMIGKGDRAEHVMKAITDHRAIYLSAIGGISAVLNSCIVSCETFLWEELGAEAVHKLVVKDFPCYLI